MSTIELQVTAEELKLIKTALANHAGGMDRAFKGEPFDDLRAAARIEAAETRALSRKLNEIEGEHESLAMVETLAEFEAEPEPEPEPELVNNPRGPQSREEVHKRVAHVIDHEGLHSGLVNYTSPEYCNAHIFDPELARMWREYEALAEKIINHLEV